MSSIFGLSRILFLFFRFLFYDLVNLFVCVCVCNGIETVKEN